MKICIIGEVSGGGVESVNRTLANEFSSENEVYLVSLKGKNKQGLLKKRVRYYSLNKRNNKSAFLDLWKLLNQIQPDIILASSLVDIYMLLIFNFFNKDTYKIVYAQHSVYSKSLKGFKNYTRNFVVPKLFNIFEKIDGIVFVSNGVEDDFKEYFKKSTANVVIYNPIVSENNNIKKITKNKTNSFKLVTAGRLEIEKNQKLLIDVVKLLLNNDIDVSLAIYGEGSLKDSLIQYAIENGVENHIDFKGYVTNLVDEVIKYDCFLLSSNYESFSNVIVEAMSVGVPVVSTDCPVGPREILNNGEFGRLVPINDRYSMKDEIVEIMSLNIDELNELCKLGYLRSRDFSIQISINKYLTFFKKILR